MQNVDINKIQEKILEIFKEFNRICQKYNLKYFAIGGTCIGAIRHKGFIPWDDDLDVAMPIEDYKKFREIAKNELNGNFKLCDYFDDDSYILKFLKIHNENTTLIEEPYKNYYKRYRGIYIDIMPIAGCPKSIIKRKIFFIKIYFLYKLNLVRRTTYKERLSFKSKIFWIIFKFFCNKKDINFFILKCEKLLSKYSFSHENDVLFAWRIPLYKPYSNLFPYNYFRETKEVKFEDTNISIPIEYDKYLTQEFGDYMKLPPKEKQNPRHIYLVDLNKSYKEYIKEMIDKKDE